MNEEIGMIMGGFMATWLQIAFLYYKVGRIEQKLKMKGNIKVGGV